MKTPKQAKKNSKAASATKVLVNFIQDRSGSMQSVWPETLSGFSAFVKDLKEKGAKDNVEYLFSLTTFDTIVDAPIVARAIGEVAEDALVSHGPRGSTALYDAVGRTIDATDKDRNGATKIICVIVTDGQENSSREWTKDTLQKAIEAKLAQGDWTFTYLGTQPETWDDAAAIGLAVGATAGYQGKMAHATYSAVADSVHTLSASASMGSRNLLHSHGNAQRMAAARMTVKPPSRPTLKNKPRRPAIQKRWR